ncbi:hypothetical protein ACI78T_10250 [Blastococcus sp. SYSU D00922]
MACTLTPVDAPDRLGRWQRLHDLAGPSAELRHGRLEVTYQPVAGVADELRELAAAEQTCCGFVDWSVTEVRGRPTLRVVAPEDRPDAVLAIAAMFGLAGAQAPSGR